MGDQNEIARLKAWLRYAIKHWEDMAQSHIWDRCCGKTEVEEVENPIRDAMAAIEGAEWPPEE